MSDRSICDESPRSPPDCVARCRCSLFDALASARRRTPAPAAVTTQTPVMGPSLLTAAQLAAWYRSTTARSSRRFPRSRSSGERRRRARAGLHRRRQGSKACAATWRSCSRCSRPAGSASSARRSRPTRTTTRASTRSTAAPALPNCAHGDSVAEPVHGHAAARRARADPVAAQLRRPDGEDADRPVDLRAVRSRRAWRRCGSTSAGTTARAASSSGRRPTTTASASSRCTRRRWSRAARPARACRTRRRSPVRSRATATGT